MTRQAWRNLIWDLWPLAIGCFGVRPASFGVCVYAVMGKACSDWLVRKWGVSCMKWSRREDGNAIATLVVLWTLICPFKLKVYCIYFPYELSELMHPWKVIWRSAVILAGDIGGQWWWSWRLQLCSAIKLHRDHAASVFKCRVSACMQMCKLNITSICLPFGGTLD